MARPHALRPCQRLRRNADFAAIREADRPYRCPYFALHARLRPPGPEPAEETPRIGLSAARRVGSSPQRNRAKRRLRELFRLWQARIHPRADLAFSLRGPAAAAPRLELERRFIHALRFKGLWLEEEPSPGSGSRLADR